MTSFPLMGQNRKIRSNQLRFHSRPVDLAKKTKSDDYLGTQIVGSCRHFALFWLV